MEKKRRLLITLLVILLLTLVSAFVMFRFDFNPFQRLEAILRVGKQPLVFSDIKSKSDAESSSAFSFNKTQGFEPEAQNDAAKHFMELYLNGSLIDNADNWNWKTSMVKVRITRADLEANSLLIRTIEPEGINITGKDIWVKIECTPDQTAAFSFEKMSYMDSNFILTDRIVTGESMYTYCQDEECSSIGKSCILIK